MDKFKNLKMSAWQVGGGKLFLGEADMPTVLPGHILIEVKTSTLNPGELLHLPYFPDGRIPGLEVAGVVVKNETGDGPAPGSRVIATTAFSGGGWAQFVALPAKQVGRIPDNVSWVNATSLPNAGMTALYAIRAGGSLLGANVLVTGAAGAVGKYAVQLARMAGAFVTGSVSGPSRTGALEGLGLDAIVVGNDARDSFDLVIDTLGGGALTHAMNHVKAGGLVVAIVGGGQQMNKPAEPALVPLSWEFSAPGARLMPLNVAAEVTRSQTVAADLGFLGSLAAGGLRPPAIGRVANWREAAGMIGALNGGEIKGKIILTME